jgi:NAD(P)H-hydrate epimerase
MEKYSADKKCIVMTRDQVRAFDAWAINTLGIPGTVLMENAGRGCAEFIKEKLAGIAKPKVCIFCGTGNNGGDGYVIARHLLNSPASARSFAETSDFNVTVVICGDRDKIAGDAKTNLDILERMNQPIEQLDLKITGIVNLVREVAADANLLVDAIFGTGLTGNLRDEYKRLIDCINAIGKPVLAVDIPSGLDCDTGQPLGAAICAACTITFVAVKAGFTLPVAQKYTGEIFVASIGIEPNACQQD